MQIKLQIMWKNVNILTKIINANNDDNNNKIVIIKVIKLYTNILIIPLMKILIRNAMKICIIIVMKVLMKIVIRNINEC